MLSPFVLNIYAVAMTPKGQSGSFMEHSDFLEAWYSVLQIQLCQYLDSVQFL